MRGAKIPTPIIKNFGATETVMAKPGLFIQLPAGLDSQTKAARVAIFLDKLQAAQKPIVTYTKKSKKQKEEQNDVYPEIE